MGGNRAALATTKEPMMKRTRAELRPTPITISIPAYRVAQLQQLAERANAQYAADGIAQTISPEVLASALLCWAIDRDMRNQGDNQQ